MTFRMVLVVAMLAGCIDARPEDYMPRAGAPSVPVSGGGGAVAGNQGGAPPSTGVPGCEAADATMQGPALHAAAAGYLAAMGTCGFSSCHGSTAKGGMLTLLGAPNLNMLLVDKPSCESALPLVKGGGGEMALQGSWLWIKLVGEVNNDGALVSQTTWGAGGKTCGQRGTAPFGRRMPESDVRSVAELSADMRLASVRNWICGGAPGP